MIRRAAGASPGGGTALAAGVARAVDRSPAGPAA
jgi:hypothetical protein